MIINGADLLHDAPISGMHSKKMRANGLTYGLSEAGYDIRIAQTIHFTPRRWWQFWKPEMTVQVEEFDELGFLEKVTVSHGRFALASTMEQFHLPKNLVGLVMDKSSWARQAVSFFNTVIEPGWGGYLTLEIVYHGNKKLTIERGTGVSQVVFFETSQDAQYEGRYQDQENRPVEAKRI